MTVRYDWCIYLMSMLFLIGFSLLPTYRRQFKSIGYRSCKITSYNEKVRAYQKNVSGAVFHKVFNDSLRGGKEGEH